MTAVGWNWSSSRSARSAPAAWASSRPTPCEPGGLVVRAHSRRGAARAEHDRARGDDLPVVADQPAAAPLGAPQRAGAGALEHGDPRLRGGQRRELAHDAPARWRCRRRARRAGPSGRPPGPARAVRSGRRRSARRAPAGRARTSGASRTRISAAECLTSAAPGQLGVAQVQLEAVVGGERRGQPALRPVAGGLRQRRGRDEHDGRVLARGAQRGVQAGRARAHHCDVGLTGDRQRGGGHRGERYLPGRCATLRRLPVRLTSSSCCFAAAGLSFELPRAGARSLRRCVRAVPSGLVAAAATAGLVVRRCAVVRGVAVRGVVVVGAPPWTCWSVGPSHAGRRLGAAVVVGVGGPPAVVVGPVVVVGAVVVLVAAGAAGVVTVVGGDGRATSRRRRRAPTSAAASTPSATARRRRSAMIGAFQLGGAARRVRAAAPQFRHHSCSGAERRAAQRAGFARGGRRCGRRYGAPRRAIAGGAGAAGRSRAGLRRRRRICVGLAPALTAGRRSVPAGGRRRGPMRVGERAGRWRGRRRPCVAARRAGAGLADAGGAAASGRAATGGADARRGRRGRRGGLGAAGGRRGARAEATRRRGAWARCGRRSRAQGPAVAGRGQRRWRGAGAAAACAGARGGRGGAGAVAPAAALGAPAMGRSTLRLIGQPAVGAEAVLAAVDARRSAGRR